MISESTRMTTESFIVPVEKLSGAHAPIVCTVAAVALITTRELRRDVPIMSKNATLPPADASAVIVESPTKKSIHSITPANQNEKTFADAHRRSATMFSNVRLARDQIAALRGVSLRREKTLHSDCECKMILNPQTVTDEALKSVSPANRSAAASTPPETLALVFPSVSADSRKGASKTSACAVPEPLDVALSCELDTVTDTAECAVAAMLRLRATLVVVDEAVSAELSTRMLLSGSSRVVASMNTFIAVETQPDVIALSRPRRVN
jgi:hypothetical protein